MNTFFVYLSSRKGNVRNNFLYSLESAKYMEGEIVYLT